MKNREKFAKEILDIACSGSTIAMNFDRKLVSCNGFTCDKCLFNSDNYENCDMNIQKWCESEYVEKPKISESDRQFLNYLPEKYKYIARDRNNFLYAYDSKVEKNDKCWIGASFYTTMDIAAFKISFPMVKWEDEEPWLIEDLKKLENYVESEDTK